MASSNFQLIRGIRVEIYGQRIAHLSHARAIEIETLVAGAGVLVIGADDVAPAPVPEGARDVVLQLVVGPEEVPGEAATKIVEDVAALPAADDGPAGPAERAKNAMKAGRGGKPARSAIAPDRRRPTRGS